MIELNIEAFMIHHQDRIEISCDERADKLSANIRELQAEAGITLCHNFHFLSRMLVEQSGEVTLTIDTILISKQI